MFKMLSMHWGSTAKLQYVYASTLNLYSRIRSDKIGEYEIIKYIFYFWGIYREIIQWMENGRNKKNIKKERYLYEINFLILFGVWLFCEVTHAII